MFLPPRAPELNPVENIWQFMRDNWLSNRIFKTYDDKGLRQEMRDLKELVAELSLENRLLKKT